MLLNKKFFSNYKYILPIGFTLIISMMGFTSFYSSSLMEKSTNFIVETIKIKNQNQQLLRKMSQVVLQRSTILVEMIQIDDPFALDELFLEFNAIATQYVVAKNELEEKIADSKFKQYFDKLNPIIRKNGRLQYDVYDLILEEDKSAAINLFVNETLPRQNKAFDIIREMEAYQFSSTRDAIQKMEDENSQTHSTLILFNLSSILFSILLTLFILMKQRKSDTKLTYLARTDILTNLPNRSNLIYNINQSINSNPENPFAIVFFDIDNFKGINDNYGHEIGDEILRQYSSIIESSVHKNDFLARLGGDEFVLILRNIKSKEDATKFLKRLSKRLDTTLSINKSEVFITSSLGVSLYPQDGTDTKTLLKHADFAMYSAKESGKNNYAFFSKETGHKMEKEHQICYSLQKILKDNNKNDELYLMYQPLLDMKNKNISECEALIRWKKDDGTELSPDEFIPLAEKTNLIGKVNLFVINEACKQQQKWQEAGITDIRININLSGNKLIFKRLFTQFKENIESMDLHPEMFGIELTERTLNEITQETIEELNHVRQLGMKISIDDFGTDYSSLSNLKKLPITTLKIDKSFIEGLPLDMDDHAMVKTIINLGHSLNLDIVAEGVETNAQLDFLKDNDCNTAQGFLFHRPLHSQQITVLKTAA